MEPISFLLVDDLDENLLSLEALLRRDGLVLLKARSGDEALELLLRHEIALALIDVQMPGLDGFELAELMRGNERTRGVPIIFVTAGNADSQRRFRGYEAGAVDFIYKPIEPDILRSKTGVFFQLYQQRQQIAAQRDDLKLYADALQEADRRKDEFLATLAHELRNPLAPLRHGLDVLQRDPHSANASTIHEMMNRQVTHLIRMVDDLLDVSRISQGKIELRREIVEAAEVVRSALETSQVQVDAAGHALTVEVPESPIWLDADPMRMAQVLSNLLNNSAKYTPQGGRISLSVTIADGDAVFAVGDNGIGIPAEKLAEIFNLFAQIDHGADLTQGGLGIGLALVKQLVTMHGGTVEGRSGGDGKGSEFIVRVPLAPSHETTGQSDPPGPADPGSCLRILVVDDNLEVSQVIGWMLETIGHEYHLVRDGRTALQAARGFRPDIIFLDIGLPGMDGYAVCRAFRADEDLKSIPIIAQSGWRQDPDKTAETGVGFDGYLVKPAKIADIARLLDEVMTTRRR